MHEKEADGAVIDMLAGQMIAESDDPVLRREGPIGDDLPAVCDALNTIRDRAAEQARRLPKSGSRSH